MMEMVKTFPEGEKLRKSNGNMREGAATAPV